MRSSIELVIPNSIWGCAADAAQSVCIGTHPQPTTETHCCCLTPAFA
jgi:hypothetical protein